MRAQVKNVGLIVCGVVAGILISVGMTAIAQREAKLPLPVTEMVKLTWAFGLIKQNYVEAVDDKKLITDAMVGMLNGLDPHTTYLDKDAMKDLNERMEGQFGGLGIQVDAEDGYVKVIAPIEDTPAARAGIKAGDLIVKINDTPTKGMQLGEAVKRMRGEPNTKITLTLVRKGEEQPIVVTLTRDVIKTKSVRSKMIEPGYAFVRISEFQRNTAVELVDHLEKLDKEGPLTGIVLDMRNDPGGDLSAAIGVAAAFLPAGSVVVSTNGRVEGAKQNLYAYPNYYLRSGEDFIQRVPQRIKDAKIVVLVNNGSASASEIVSGALQDHKRAAVMGSLTFGKASVQTVEPYVDENGKKDGTGIKLTISRYYTPSGRSIQAKGILPDLLVAETADGDVTQFHTREVDLERHLSNKQQAEEKRIQAAEAAEKEGKKSEPKRKIAEFGSAEDYQLQQAMNHLKGLPVAVVKPGTEMAEHATEKVTEKVTDKAAADKAVEKKNDKPAKPAKPAEKAKEKTVK